VRRPSRVLGGDGALGGVVGHRATRTSYRLLPSTESLEQLCGRGNADHAGKGRPWKATPGSSSVRANPPSIRQLTRKGSVKRSARKPKPG
jgi:hypothetical protein